MLAATTAVGGSGTADVAARRCAPVKMPAGSWVTTDALIRRRLHKAFCVAQGILRGHRFAVTLHRPQAHIAQYIVAHIRGKTRQEKMTLR